MAHKPTVFFSHSSSDKRTLHRLKEMFAAKVGGSIDVFLSSDGQSIPFGQNWVHKIQEALDRAALMVIFVTPSALTSGWVYFEAGYSYSKNIRVVPVGFLGIDLGQLNPPLSLLQGFNITSADGLNNLIALTNEVFAHNHLDEFSSSDFSQLVNLRGESASPIFGEVGGIIDELSLNLSSNELAMSADAAIEAASTIVTRHQIRFHRESDRILGAGFDMTQSSDRPSPGIRIEADPLLLGLSFKAIQQILGKIRKGGILGTEMYFQLIPGMAVIQDKHKITARVYDTKIAFDKDGDLVLDNVAFGTGKFYGHGPSSGAAYVEVSLKASKVSLTTIAELLTILYQNGVIYTSNPLDAGY